MRIQHTIHRSVAVSASPRVKQLEGKFSLEPLTKSVATWDVDVTLPEKWNVGVIVGASGSGKTAVVRLIAEKLGEGKPHPSGCSRCPAMSAAGTGTRVVDDAPVPNAATTPAIALSRYSLSNLSRDERHNCPCHVAEVHSASTCVRRILGLRRASMGAAAPTDHPEQGQDGERARLR